LILDQSAGHVARGPAYLDPAQRETRPFGWGFSALYLPSNPELPLIWPFIPSLCVLKIARQLPYTGDEKPSCLGANADGGMVGQIYSTGRNPGRETLV
jgi:hypothetical protein